MRRDGGAICLPRKAECPHTHLYFLHRLLQPKEVISTRNWPGTAGLKHEAHAAKRALGGWLATPSRGARHGRWAREVFKYIHLKCINTKWVLRTKRLTERYEVAPCRLTEKLQRDRRTKVRGAVQEAESASWRTMGAGKPALSFYSKAKQAIEKEPLYENSKGSGLLCEASCGMLRTRLLRATYTPNLDMTCPLCTLEEESIEHIVLRCPALKPQVSATSSAAATPPEQRQTLLAMALGFRESQEQPQRETVEATKRRLEHWWCTNYLQDRTGPAANTPNQ
ncbi:hypothetical protein HPB52_022490 [Rhipicephalus sanguineus]|uniref:Tick transposon n=1 Tax=Rhipicephalus sanguineus TaxID=34632 RepID=A0A9D4Q8I8_RHISA|nr:hypothetical protein HPB52_022490 [Rhipicephalus sanguineus]